MSEIKMLNMCMVLNKDRNEVLVQERTKSWVGIAFPGGHIEDGESIIQSTIRETKEETGLTVSNLESCGIVYEYNQQTRDRFFVYNFKTHTYSGELIDETEEGKVFWVDVGTLTELDLVPSLRKRLPMFLSGKFIEGFGTGGELQLINLSS